MTEKRRAPRVQLGKPVRVKVRTFHPAEILNISNSGILLALSLPLRPRATCEIRLDLGGGDIVVRGTVRRSWLKGHRQDPDGSRSALYHVGMEFDQPQPDLVGEVAMATRSDVRVGFGPAELPGRKDDS